MRVRRSLLLILKESVGFQGIDNTCNVLEMVEIFYVDIRGQC